MHTHTCVHTRIHIHRQNIVKPTIGPWLEKTISNLNTADLSNLIRFNMGAEFEFYLSYGVVVVVVVHVCVLGVWGVSGSSSTIGPVCTLLPTNTSNRQACSTRSKKEKKDRKTNNLRNQSNAVRAQSRMKRRNGRAGGQVGAGWGLGVADRGGSLGGPGQKWASSGKGGGGRSTGEGGVPGPRPQGGVGPGWGLQRSTSTPGPRAAPPAALRKDQEQHTAHETDGKELRKKRCSKQGGAEAVKEHLSQWGQQADTDSATYTQQLGQRVAFNTVQWFIKWRQVSLLVSVVLI